MHLMRDAPTGRTGNVALLKASGAYPRPLGKAVVQAWSNAGVLEERFKDLPVACGWVSATRVPKTETKGNKKHRGTRGKGVAPKAVEENFNKKKGNLKSKKIGDRVAGPWEAQAESSEQEDGSESRSEKALPSGPWATVGTVVRGVRLSKKRAAPSKFEGRTKTNSALCTVPEHRVAGPWCEE